MPNIEVVGFDHPNAMVDSISAVLEEIGLAKDAVVTVVNAVVWTCDKLTKGNPYLRICDTNMHRAMRIVRALKAKKFLCDIEIVKLYYFVKAKDVQ